MSKTQEVQYTKNPTKIPSGNPICDVGPAMHTDRKLLMEMATCDRNSAGPFARLKPVNVSVITATGTIAGKPEAVRNTIPFVGDYRLSIGHNCLRFKRNFSLRSECERNNSR